MAKYTYDQNGKAYQLKGGKHTCSACSQHTLQLYIGVDDGEPINDQVGKCDRHYNCGYDYTPKQYYADHPSELPPDKNGKRRYLPEPERPVIPIDRKNVLQSLIPSAIQGMSTFTDYLLRMFPAESIKRVIDDYYLGRTKSKAVIFWQIDEKGIVRDGKAMKYLPTGNRDKASWAVGESFWIFSTLQSRGELPAKDGEREVKSAKCIFGQHLLRHADKTTRVCIVESEKNAVFGSLMLPDYLWLAVGSSEEVGKVWKVKNLLAQCKSVVFIPDADAVNDWRENVEKFHLPNATVNDFCAGHAGGYDIADYAYYQWYSNPHVFMPKTTESQNVEQHKVDGANSEKLAESERMLKAMIEANPAVGILVETLKLEIAA
jgi:hypothetical protein